MSSTNERKSQEQIEARRARMVRTKERIRKAMVETGTTYQDIADACGYSKMFVYNLIHPKDQRHHLRVCDIDACAERTHTKMFAQELGFVAGGWSKDL